MIYQLIFGTITPPYTGTYKGDVGSGKFGLIVFLNNVLKMVFVVGGLLVLINLIIAGFQFINAGGDPKQIEGAWNKIWQSLVGLAIMVCSFVIVAIFSWLLFGDAAAILNPKIYSP